MEGYLLKMGGLGKEKKRIGTQCLSRYSIAKEVIADCLGEERWLGLARASQRGGRGTDRVTQGAPGGWW
jgi:hypothetical protein